MFEHPKFRVYEFEDIPLNEECWLMGQEYAKEYEKCLLKYFEEELCSSAPAYEPVGRGSSVVVLSVHEDFLELSWCPLMPTKFHEVSVTLPREEFVACVEYWNYDKYARLFVKDDWLYQLHLKHYSSFAMIDVANAKDAIREGKLSRDKLIRVRDAIDALAAEHPEISFISFADSLILKSNWTIGHFRSDVLYTYRPETLLRIFQKLKSIYAKHLGVDIYGVFTQGANEYYEDNELHISPSNNHICLNSLGAPFADLMTIERTAKDCIKMKTHPPCELYIDSDFYHSLRLEYEFDKHKQSKVKYSTKLRQQDGYYYYCQCDDILNNLKD